MNFEITPKMRADYRKALSQREFMIAMAGYLCDAVAAWLRAEWARDYGDEGDYVREDYWTRADWTFEQWQAEAHKMLTGVQL